MHHCTECGAEFVAPRAQCSDCGGPIAAGPSPRFAAPTKRAKPVTAPAPVVAPATPPVFDGPRPALPPSGLRHCRACHAEFDGALIDCSDCGAPLFPGGSPRFEAPGARAPEGGDLSADDFVPLRRIENGWHADVLCSLLADAGIATMMVTDRGRRMRAPGLDPMGPAPAENESVEILVFPELIDEAGGILDEAEERHADDEIVVPVDGPGAGCGTECAPPPAAGTSPVVFVLGGLVVLVGLAAALLFR